MVAGVCDQQVARSEDLHRTRPGQLVGQLVVRGLQSPDLAQKAAHMTQEELALRTGVSRQTIMSIERSRTNPSILLAYKIARALNVDVNDVCLRLRG